MKMCSETVRKEMSISCLEKYIIFCSCELFIPSCYGSPYCFFPDLSFKPCIVIYASSIIVILFSRLVT